MIIIIVYILYILFAYFVCVSTDIQLCAGGDQQLVFFYNAGPGDGTLVVWLLDGCLYLMSHFAGLSSDD